MEEENNNTPPRPETSPAIAPETTPAIAEPSADPDNAVAETTPPVADTPSKKRGAFGGFSVEFLVVVLMLGILLLGAYFRFVGLNWDDGTHLHPDERFLTGVANSLQSVSDPLAYLRTSESPLNPYNTGNGFYVYGNFPMTVTRYAAEMVQQLCTLRPAGCLRNFVGYDGIHLVGRALSGLVDLISIVFIFLIGRRLYDWRAGLLAALLLAMAVMPIQQAHFFTMDSWAAALTTVTLYFAVLAAENARQKRWWVLFGLFLGLTVASRINVAPLAGMAGVAALVWLLRQAKGQAALAYLSSERGKQDIFTIILGVGLAALVSIFAFRLAQPYAFADAAIAEQTAIEAGQNPDGLGAFFNALVGFNPQWRSNMSEIQGQQSPEATFPPALQWTDRTPLIFPWTNMVLYGMGIAAGLMAWIGFFWAIWQIARARPGWVAHLIPVTWVAFYFLFMGTRWVKSIRYFLPIYPFLLLLAGWALVEIWKRAGERRGYRLAAGVLVALVVVPTFLWANAFVEIYRQPLTRVAASRWMYENVPTAVTLLYETANGAAEELQLPNNGFELRTDGTQSTVIQFEMPADGQLSGLRLNHVFDPAGDADNETFTFTLRDLNGNEVSTTEHTAGLGLEKETVSIEMDPAALNAGDPLILEIGLTAGDGIIADTSRIVNEHWDDLLPVSIDGKAAYGNYYREVEGGQRPITWPDNNAEKRQMMLDWIDEADYIALSSQRALWSTPRLPLTYPLNIAYYESLFNGDLGFELAAQFHGDMQIGPLYISDTGAEIGWGEPPEIGWPPPGALAVEEAFSVYDHPPVWIFRKTENYSAAQAQQILGAVDLNEVVVMNPGQATAAPNGLLLSPAEQAVQQENGTFSELFATDGILAQQPWLAAIIWWLAVILLGWLAFPLAFVVFRGFPGRGYAISRILSLLFISYFGWIMASTNILPNTRGTLLLGTGLLVVISLLMYWRHRPEIHQFVRQNLAYIAFVELFGVALFAFSMLIRLGNPDVWDIIWGGEKPMDLSYFNAVLKSTTFPPYDPWFSGGYINYYYYGFVYTGALTKLLGIPPAIAYNLILPMLFSFTGLGAFSIAYNLAAKRELRHEQDRPEADTSAEISADITPVVSAPARRLRTYPLLAGIAAAIFCVLLGNLAEVGVVVDSWQRASEVVVDTGVPFVDTALRTIDGATNVIFSGEPAPIGTGDWFWTATRAINVNPGETAPITEFPYFTFLYGDLHAHMISLPLTLLALAWAVSLVLRTARFDPATRPRWPEAVLLWFIGGLAIGVLRPTNTWDWPPYLFLGCLAAIYFALRREGKLNGSAFGSAGLFTVLLVALSTLTFWPYISHYGQGYESLSLWEGSNTYFGNYLVIWGLFLFLALTHLLREFRAWSATWTPAGLRRLQPVAWLLVIAAFLFVLLLVLLMFLGYWVAPFALTLTLIAGLLGLRPGLPVERRVVLILISSALGLTLLVEFVVLEGDIGRMNTVFKFYMQVWTMLSVACATALAWVWPATRRQWSPAGRRIWRLGFVLFIAAAALYPILATRAKWQTRMSADAPTTLDGMAFMETTTYNDTALDGSSQTIPLDLEYEALTWMQENIVGSPVIVEAHSGNPYRSIAARVAMYTGLPTVIGWDWHQRQQRVTVPDSMVWNRVGDVDTLFNTTDTNEALRILDKYNVQYIYAGQLEWTYYQPEGMRKFDQMVAQGYLEEVFRNEGVSIYRVIQTETAGVSQ